MLSDPYPPFDVAVARFKVFLGEQAWPQLVSWVAAGQVMRAGNRVWIREHRGVGSPPPDEVYDQAVGARIGVAFEALCHSTETTYARIVWPSTAEAAQRLMFPDDLKLSVLCHPPVVQRARGALVWWLARRRWPAWPEDDDEVSWR